MRHNVTNAVLSAIDDEEEEENEGQSMALSRNRSVFKNPLEAKHHNFVLKLLVLIRIFQVTTQIFEASSL